MEPTKKLSREPQKGEIAIKGTISKPDKVGDAKEPEVRVPEPRLPERPS